jgi:5-hydroxyisourate hydrolase
MSPITTHVLDTARGRPASGIHVSLEARVNDAWIRLGDGRTDDDGRVHTLFREDVSLDPAVYRLIFDTGAYFASLAIETFYPRVVVEFAVAEGQAHYHVPLLLSPFGYSTYRGS